MKSLYQRSLGYNLVYKYLIGDGDTKSFCDVWDFYDLCEDCNRYILYIFYHINDETTSISK